MGTPAVYAFRTQSGDAIASGAKSEPAKTRSFMRGPDVAKVSFRSIASYSASRVFDSAQIAASPAELNSRTIFAWTLLRPGGPLSLCAGLFSLANLPV